MPKIMMTIRSDQPPTLADLRQRFGLGERDVDESFGVIEVDPVERLYTFMVEEAKARALQGEPEVSGPYSNPRIAHFGPQDPPATASE